MPRTKKIPAPPTEPEAPPPPPVVAEPVVVKEEELDIVNPDEDEDALTLEDEDDFLDPNEDLVRAAFQLFTDDHGHNVAQLMGGILETLEKTNKILYKMMTLLEKKAP